MFQLRFLLPADHQEKQIRHRGGPQRRIDHIQDSPKSRQVGRGILGLGIAFEHRFGQISKLSDKSKNSSKKHSIYSRHYTTKVGKKRTDDGRQYYRAGHPLPRLAGRDRRSELVPADARAVTAVFLGRRDKPHTERVSLKREAFTAEVTGILDDIQNTLFARAQAFRIENTVRIDEKGEFYDFFTPRNLDKPEIHGGFAVSSWCGDPACEAKIKEDLTVTIRCIPFEQEEPPGKCLYCGRPGQHRVVFAKAY